ncbi:MAG: hypothetical protein K5696_05220, partial [Lachnospiraceae bacterium]|nr:hypothetical protein [Lachnospiraceae bacterium]
MPNQVRNDIREEQIHPENPADLFTEDEGFYTTDARTDEEIAREEENRLARRRNMPIVPGFFDDEKTLARVERINEEVLLPGMLKVGAGSRLMDDMRLYYLGKGECSYTTTEPVTDEEGKPVWREDGQQATREVVRTIPVTNFAEAMDLNNLPMEARGQIVDHFLTDLENHPIASGVDEATAEANAHYLARIHKTALERNYRSPWPEIDVDQPGAVEELANGQTPLGALGDFAVNFSQNSEVLVNSNPRFEKKRPNRVRIAYLDELGGIEEYARLKERQDLAQGLHSLSSIVTSPQGFGLTLRQKALAKYYIGYYNGIMHQVNQLGNETYREGLGLEAQSLAGYLFTPGAELSDAGAPTDEQLQAYLDGRTGSPFSEAYINETRKTIREARVVNSRSEIDHYTRLLNDEIDTSIIYNLPYVQMPHKVPDDQGQMKDAPQQLPDPYALTPEEKHETDRVFDRTLGNLTGTRPYGMQAYYALLRKERVIDRFRIGGQKASDYLAAHGFPQLAQDLGQKDAETGQKAAILTALADPNLEVTFVPLVMGNNNLPVDAEPIRLAPPARLILPSRRETAAIPAELPDDEAAKYYAAMDSYSVNMSAVLACDPGRNVIELQTDDHLKETLRSDDTHKDGKRQDLVPRTLMEKLFYNPGADDGNPPFENLGFMKNYMGSGKSDEANPYALLVGTQKNGSLNNEGKQNLSSLKSFIHTMRDWTDRVADSYEKKSPLLAEYIRLYTDELLTVEDGSTWFDNVHDTTYMVVRNQLGGLGAPREPRINASSPQFVDDMLKAVTGYPTGEPGFPLPQAITAARRQVLMAAECKRAAREGTLTRRQERQSRRMLLSELDTLEKHLRTIDRVAEKSRIPGTPEEALRRDLQDDSAHRQYMDNDPYDSSSFYPRGTKRAWFDMEGKRALLANGWPLEDLNLLGNLFWRRQYLKDEVEKDRSENPSPETLSRKRAIKVLDQILGELERTPVRNAADRRRLLQMIDGYGDHFYNSEIISTEPNIKNQLRKEIRAAIERQPSELEFLSEEELAQAREAYRRYQERKSGPDPDAPTVNGPRTEVERAFLNAHRLGLLYTMQGRLAGDRAFARDQVHGETLAQLDSFLAQVERFYANTDLLKEDQQAARDAAFAKLVQDSATLSAQIGRSIDQLTNNGRKERFSKEETRQLESLRNMQDQVRHMRSLHAAQIDFEIRRREDLARYQQEEQRKREEKRQLQEDVARIKLVDNEDGTFYADRDYLVSQLSDEAIGYLTEAYPNGLPDMFLVQNFDGHLMPEEVHRRMTEDRERIVAKLREEKQQRREAVIAERAQRREELTAQDFTDAADDLFAMEDSRLEDERRAETEQLQKELRAIGREEEAARAELRQRIEAIAADDSYDWDMRRARIEEEEDRFEMQRAADGTGWGPRRAQIEERLRQLDAQAADRQFAATRRQQEALDTGDERYTWSFRHILQDVCDRKNAAEQALAEAKNNPDSTVHDITEKGIRAFEESERYKMMMNLVGASFETEKLRAALEKRWPDWFAQTLTPALAGMTDPRMRHSQMINSMRNTLPAEEVHAFLDEQIATLRVDLKEDLRRRLLTLQTKAELAYEDQVVHPLHERVEELKRQGLFDSAGHLLNRKGVPYHPDSIRDGLLVDERGIPYPPDSEEQKEYQHQKALAEALDYADQVVTSSDSKVRAAYQKHHNIHEEAYEAKRRRDFDELIAGMQQNYRNMLNALLTDGQAFVSNVVEPWEVDFRDYMINSGYEITPEHNDKITQLLTYMEEMNLPMSDDLPGGTGEDRAFSNLAAAQDALTQAVQGGDAEKILAAKQNLEQARKDIEKLYAYVKNEANFPAESVPGNTDATRQSNVPLEYSRDTFASSKLNGIYTLYSALKWAGISIREFHDDPNDAIKRLYEKSMEAVDPEEQFGNKRVGEILGGFAAETGEDRSKRIAQTKTIQEVVRRGVEAIVTMGNAEEARKMNLLTATLHEQYNANVLDHRLKHTNPYTDPKRKTEVQQLLSIVDEESLETNRSKMLMSKPLNDRGYAVETITAENYVDSLGPDFDKYMDLVTRGEEMLTDAARIAGAGFNPVEFMENRQKALSMMLIRRVADRNKDGFSILEDEIVNTAEYYESIRLAHPELPIPALTAEQKKLFDTRGKQFKQQLKRAENALSRDQKRQIANRAAQLREQLAGMRRAADHRGRVTAELEKRNIHLWEPVEAMQAAPAGNRISNEEAAARLNRQQDAARQRQEARAQEERNRLLAEEARNAREASFKEKLALPLTGRLDDVFREYFWSQYTRNEMLKQGLDKSQPESFFEAALNANDAQRRMKELLHAVTENLTTERFAGILTETLGPEKAGQLLTGFHGLVPQRHMLQNLPAEDRMAVFAALAGSLPAERQSELLFADDSYQTIRGMDTTSPVTIDSYGPEKTLFERQVDHPATERVNDILRQAGLDWKGMTDGKG